MWLQISYQVNQWLHWCNDLLPPQDCAVTVMVTVHLVGYFVAWVAFLMFISSLSGPFCNKEKSVEPQPKELSDGNSTMSLVLDFF